jgi:hypothetical protein
LKKWQKRRENEVGGKMEEVRGKMYFGFLVGVVVWAVEKFLIQF